MGEKSNYLPEYDCDRVDLRMWIQNKNPIPILPNVWINERGLRMAKCTGMRCQMQVGFKVNECNYKECPHRTEPTTKADRIRHMSDEELEEGIRELRFGYEPWCDNHCKMQDEDNCNICLKDWLQQPAKGE